MRVSEQTREQIMAVLRRMTDAMGRKDVEALVALADPEFRAFGTGADEKAIGREEYRRHLERGFAQAETVALDLSDVRIGAEGTVAWVMADMTCRFVVDGIPRTLDGRMTAVLRGTGHAWVFAQMHYSFPAEGRPYPA